MLYILNGPNLDFLGKREVSVYGEKSLLDIQLDCEALARAKNMPISFLQSNYEGQLIDWVHEADQKARGLIINAAGLTHTSVSLGDAIKILTIPTIELHITNPYKRESFRHISYLSPVVSATIAGFGWAGYTLALKALIELIERS